MTEVKESLLFMNPIINKIVLTTSRTFLSFSFVVGFLHLWNWDTDSSLTEFLGEGIMCVKHRTRLTHRSISGKLLILTAVRPPSRWGSFTNETFVGGDSFPMESRPMQREPFWVNNSNDHFRTVIIAILKFRGKENQFFRANVRCPLLHCVFTTQWKERIVACHSTRQAGSIIPFNPST